MDICSPTDPLSAWTSLCVQCLSDATSMYWTAASQVTQSVAGPANPWIVSMGAATSAMAASQPRSSGRSWYRHPERTGFMAPFFEFGRAFPDFGAFWHRFAMGTPMPFAPGLAPVGLTGFSFADDYRDAWLEGACRAMMPAPWSDMMGAVRKPEVGIPFVSYRSDSGYAVAQIAHATTRMMAGSIPALAFLPSAGSA